MRLKTPLDWAIWNATRNIAVCRTDTPSGVAKLDYEKTARAKMDVETNIREAFEIETVKEELEK